MKRGCEKKTHCEAGREEVRTKLTGCFAVKLKGGVVILVLSNE